MHNCGDIVHGLTLSIPYRNQFFVKSFAGGLDKWLGCRTIAVMYKICWYQPAVSTQPLNTQTLRDLQTFTMVTFYENTWKPDAEIHNIIKINTKANVSAKTTLCLKKSMWRYLFEHNSNINCPIIIIFGSVVTETISYWIDVSLFHLTYLVHKNK